MLFFVPLKDRRSHSHMSDLNRFPEIVDRRVDVS